MKIADLIYDLLIEEVKDKALLNFLLKKWYGETPNENQRKEGEFLIEKYISLKNGNRLEIHLLQIKTFLRRYNNFDAVNLKNPRNFDLNAIKFLVGEYYEIPNFEAGTPETEEIDPMFVGKNLPANKERIEASKNLWYSNNKNLIIDEGDFRVYSIPDQKSSINFGYYEGYITKTPVYENQPKSHIQWCTTRHMVDSNLWSNYRNRAQNRTFYFVIDETKNPEIQPNAEISQYYLGALQRTDDTRKRYRLTSILNNGSDPEFSEEELIKIYPKLENHFDKFVTVPFNAAYELGSDDATIDLVDLINEIPGNQYEFSSRSNAEKRLYIQRGKLITQPLSWEFMNEDLKKNYIDTLETQFHVNEKIGKKLFEYIKKEWPENLKSLDRRLKTLTLDGKTGVGVEYLNTKFIKEDHNKEYTGKKNGNIQIYQKKNTHYFGIFDSIKGDWLESNGVKYDCTFVESDSDFKETKDGNTLLIDKYLNPNGVEFYTVHIGLSVSNDDSTARVYILSSQQYHSLSQLFDERPEDFSANDADLGEMKKGL
jgi:hypothetical protein